MIRRIIFKLFATAGMLLMTAYVGKACTNFLISRGASADNSTMITYAADSHTLYGELYYFQSAVYPAGSMLDIYEWDTGKFLGKIKQAAQTYSVVGNMNEYQVAIGETTFGGRKECIDTTGIMDYGSLIYIALQRSKTAREAIKVMTDLVAEYGYYSSGESFSISDPKEVWILEMVGKGVPPTVKDKKSKSKVNPKGAVWVAIRIPDGYISGHANQARITQIPFADKENCMYSPDVVQFAREKGWYTGEDKDFSFSDTYAPLDYGALRFCEARVWSGFRRVNPEMDKYFDYVNGDSKERMPLYIKPVKKLTVHDVMELMRDHYQGTYFDMTKDIGAGPFSCPYRWRPMTWKYENVDYCHERAISTQQTGFSFVAQSRDWLPNHIGGIIWFGVDDTYSTVYVPMYCGIDKIPESFAVGNGNMLNFTWKSAFWVFNFVSNWAYTRYSDMIPIIRNKQKELEMGFFEAVAAMDKEAAEIYKTDPAKARQMITVFSVTKGNETVDQWRTLGEYLFTKFMDGNVKKEKDGKFINNGYTQPAHPDHPAYPDFWYKTILQNDPNHFKMKELK